MELPTRVQALKGVTSECAVAEGAVPKAAKGLDRASGKPDQASLAKALGDLAMPVLE